jgi:NADH-quinone oxidoreductase subunit M
MARWDALLHGLNSETEQIYVFWAIFLAFAIKMPIFPFHTWQPDTYVVAPTPGTMLLSGIMLKMGTYGLLRWLMPLVPAGVAACGETAMILSIIGIIYASCIAIVQKDFKRLIAYSSIAHVGLIAAGILSWNVEGISGAIMQMIAHGINVVGLFFIAEIIYNRTNTREIQALGGLRHVAPQLALLFLIILLGSVALPMTNGFVGEFLLLNGVFKYNLWFAVAAGSMVILGAVYMLRSYQGLMLGETNARTEKVLDLDEKIILIGLSILIIWMGVYPKPFLEIAQPAIQTLLETVKQ